MHLQIIRGIQPSFSSSSEGRVIVGGQPWELTARAGECFVVYPQPFCRFYHCVGEAREAGYRGSILSTTNYPKIWCRPVPPTRKGWHGRVWMGRNRRVTHPFKPEQWEPTGRVHIVNTRMWSKSQLCSVTSCALRDKSLTSLTLGLHLQKGNKDARCLTGLQWEPKWDNAHCGYQACTSP